MTALGRPSAVQHNVNAIADDEGDAKVDEIEVIHNSLLLEISWSAFWQC